LTVLLGLLGGTFDPVHNGHLAIARDVRDALDLSGVRLIINALPPHREPPEASVEARLGMLEAALADGDDLTIDTRELDRTGPSFSIWTLRSLRREFPRASLCWIVGVDAWRGIRSWYHWHELSSLAHLVVVTRPGFDLDRSDERWLTRDAGVLARRCAGGRVLHRGPDVDVSASGVRRRLAAGGDVSELVPPPVLEYIRRRHLYDYHHTPR